MAWKAEILTLIETNATAAPISLKEAVQKSGKTIGGVNRAEYSRVQVEGRYQHDKTRYYFTQQKGKIGWTLFTPLEYDKDHFIFINRGFITDQMRKNSKAEGFEKPMGDVRVTGLLRMGLKAKTSRFVPDNVIKKNQYFWRSLSDMAVGSFGASGQVITGQGEASAAGDRGQKVLAFSLDLEKNDHTKQWPQAGTTILKPANNHFTYMMTWFSFALTLLIITGFFLAGERRKG